VVRGEFERQNPLDSSIRRKVEKKFLVGDNAKNRDLRPLAQGFRAIERRYHLNR